MILSISFPTMAQQWHGGQPQEWKNLIGPKYPGPDKDLIGFHFFEMKISCDRLFQSCVTLWEQMTERPTPGKSTKDGLEKYTIHFRVLHRKGRVLFKKSFQWVSWDLYSKKYSNFSNSDQRNAAVVKEGKYVAIDSNFSMAKLGDIPFRYTTIEFWVSDIKWKRKKTVERRRDDGRRAFSIEEALQGNKK